MKPASKTYTILDMRKLLSIFFIVTLVVYFITSPGKTPFDYFTRLADSFIDEKYYLNDNPPWLSELVPAGENKYFVVYPPMPALVLIPFRYLLGNSFEQRYLTFLLGAGIVVLTMAISWIFKKNKGQLIFMGLLTAFGNIIWFLSSVGSSWYLGQISAAFFITAAIYESLKRKRPLLVGIFIGAAFLSRLHTILSLPLFIYLFFDKKGWFQNYFKIALGIIPFLGFNFYYNFIRFGTVFDKAYLLIPGLLDEPWFRNGLFNIKYIPNGLRAMFLLSPRYSNTFPYLTPSWRGLSILFTSPILIFTLFNGLKDKINLFTWISILPIAIVVLSHGTTGFAQFGYRFAVDFYPLLFLLLINYFSIHKINKFHWLLLAVGIIVNLWGVICINKLGLVGF
ncbi:MAG: hypothetical protein ACD_19C00016G0031 [uncultured bacterium]|nr:MAG: hypothetical protein ACD_19C00016G0031 [uncultured bacterium]